MAITLSSALTILSSEAPTTYFCASPLLIWLHQFSRAQMAAIPIKFCTLSYACLALWISWLRSKLKLTSRTISTLESSHLTFNFPRSIRSYARWRTSSSRMEAQTTTKMYFQSVKELGLCRRQINHSVGLFTTSKLLLILDRLASQRLKPSTTSKSRLL